MVITEEKLLKDIILLEKKLNNSQSLTQAYYTILDINSCICLYNNLFNGELSFKNASNKLENFAKKRSYLLACNFIDYEKNKTELTKMSKYALDMYEKCNFILSFRKDYKKISYKEFLEIMKEFLGNYGNRQYKLFNEAIKQGTIDLSKSGCKDDETKYMYILDHDYITVNRDYSVEGLGVLSHEFAHLDTLYVLRNRSSRQIENLSNTFYEAYSEFMELCFIDFMKNNHIMLKDTAIYESDFYTNLYYFLKEMYELGNNYISVTDEEDIDVISYIGDTYQYSISYSIALHLYERYKNEKKEVKKDIDNFIFNTGLVDKDTQLEMLGVNKEDVFKPKVLKKHLDEHDEFYKKHAVRENKLKI